MTVHIELYNELSKNINGCGWWWYERCEGGGGNKGHGTRGDKNNPKYKNLNRRKQIQCK